MDTGEVSMRDSPALLYTLLPNKAGGRVAEVYGDERSVLLLRREEPYIIYPGGLGR